MRSKCLLSVIIATAIAAPAASQSVTAGIEAWQKADYSAAVAIWRPLADKGDAAAEFNLGQAYRLGRGVPQDLVAAQDWFERSARTGNVDAQSTLGLMLLQSGNQTGGLRWLKTAAAKGDAKAMLVYGSLLFNGEGVPRDPLLGYAYVNRAAETGLEPARMTLERMNEILPAEDREKALELSLSGDGGAPMTAEKPAKPKVKKVVAVAEAKVPAQPPAKRTSAPTMTGAWRVQLGAFSKRSSAEALFDRLSPKSALSGRKPFFVAAGPVTRLQAGPFESEAEAQAACDALKPQPCFPVAAK
jgi:uncharacterized protein